MNHKTKFSAIVSLILIICCTRLHAQKQAVLGEAETKWPGIRYVLYAVTRIPGDRVMFNIRITATAKAPKEGTLIGITVPIPPDATKEDIDRGTYAPLPFSLDSSVVTDEKTGKQYPAVKPVPGDNTLSGEILCTLRPLQGETMAVLFAIPPALDENGRPVKQTASLLLANAVSPITKVLIPPPAASPAPSAH